MSPPVMSWEAFAILYAVCSSLNPVHLLCWAGLLTGVAMILTRNIHGTAIILGAISSIW